MSRSEHEPPRTAPTTLGAHRGCEVVLGPPAAPGQLVLRRQRLPAAQPRRCGDAPGSAAGAGNGPGRAAAGGRPQRLERSEMLNNAPPGRGAPLRALCAQPAFKNLASGQHTLGDGLECSQETLKHARTPEAPACDCQQEGKGAGQHKQEEQGGCREGSGHIDLLAAAIAEQGKEPARQAGKQAAGVAIRYQALACVHQAPAAHATHRRKHPGHLAGGAPMGMPHRRPCCLRNRRLPCLPGLPRRPASRPGQRACQERRCQPGAQRR